MPAPRSALDVHDVHAPAAAQDVFYPCSDGRPMADNVWQSRAILKAAGDLKVAHPEALAVADILVYPEEGNPKNRVAPDVLVAFGVGTHSRSSYKVWEEGKPPDWVLEVASPSTAANDLAFKRRAYAAMGVPEYWLFERKPHGARVPKPAPNRKQSVRSGKPRIAWPCRLASRSWRPLFSMLKSALSSVCELVRPTTNPEILRDSTGSVGVGVRRRVPPVRPTMRRAGGDRRVERPSYSYGWDGPCTTTSHTSHTPICISS